MDRPPEETPAAAQLRLAVERTDLAHRRTMLAEERTYSAWVRTGLAAVAAGFAISHLVESPDRAQLAGLMGGLFVITGAATFILAYLGYRNSLRRQDLPPAGRVRLAVLGLVTLALLFGAAIGLLLVVLG